MHARIMIGLRAHLQATNGMPRAGATALRQRSGRATHIDNYAGMKHSACTHRLVDAAAGALSMRRDACTHRDWASRTLAGYKWHAWSRCNCATAGQRPRGAYRQFFYGDAWRSHTSSFGTQQRALCRCGASMRGSGLGFAHTRRLQMACLELMQLRYGRAAAAWRISAILCW